MEGKKTFKKCVKFKYQPKETHEGEILTDDSDSYIDKKHLEKIAIFNRDGIYIYFVVEKSIKAVDLCDSMKSKLRLLNKDNYYIVESWKQQGLERQLEDEEDVRGVYVRMKTITNGQGILMFRKEAVNYWGYFHPQEFRLEDEDQLPCQFSRVWLKVGNNPWKRTFLLLYRGELYMCQKLKNIATFMEKAVLLCKKREDNSMTQGTLNMLKNMADTIGGYTVSDSEQQVDDVYPNFCFIV